MFIEKKNFLYIWQIQNWIVCVRILGLGRRAVHIDIVDDTGKEKKIQKRNLVEEDRSGLVLSSSSPPPWHCIGLLLLIFMRSHHKERKVVHMWFIFFGSFLLWLACFWWMSCNSIQYVLWYYQFCNYQLLNILTERRKNFPLLLFNSGFLNCWIRLVS